MSNIVSDVDFFDFAFENNVVSKTLSNETLLSIKVKFYPYDKRSMFFLMHGEEQVGVCDYLRQAMVLFNNYEQYDVYKNKLGN